MKNRTNILASLILTALLSSCGILSEYSSGTHLFQDGIYSGGAGYQVVQVVEEENNTEFALKTPAPTLQLAPIVFTYDPYWNYSPYARRMLINPWFDWDWYYLTWNYDWHYWHHSIYRPYYRPHYRPAHRPGYRPSPNRPHRPNNDRYRISSGPRKDGPIGSGSSSVRPSSPNSGPNRPSSIGGPNRSSGSSTSPSGRNPSNYKSSSSNGRNPINYKSESSSSSSSRSRSSYSGSSSSRSSSSYSRGSSSSSRGSSSYGGSSGGRSSSYNGSSGRVRR